MIWLLGSEVHASLQYSDRHPNVFKLHTTYSFLGWVGNCRYVVAIQQAEESPLTTTTLLDASQDAVMHSNRTETIPLL